MGGCRKEVGVMTSGIGGKLSRGRNPGSTKTEERQVVVPIGHREEEQVNRVGNVLRES